MKNEVRALLAGGLLIVTSAASAAESPFSANVAVTSDYRFRGFSQSAKDPALQGGADYAKDGWNAGIWASTIDFGDTDGDVEVDLYGGYSWKGAGIDWTVGLIHYAYPGSDSADDLPFTEVYVGGSYGPVSVKYYYTNDFTATDDKSAYYILVGASFELGGGFNLGLSAGRSDGDAFVDGVNDYKIGVSKEFGGFNFDLSYVDTSGAPEITDDVFNSESTVVLTISKTF